MKKEDFFYLGYIQKALKKGEAFRAVLDTDEPEKYQSLEVLFLSINNTYIPFFLESFQLQGNIATIVFEEETTEGIEELIAGSKIYLPSEALPELKGNQFYYHEVKGFEVIDSKHGNLGKLEEVLDLPNQALFRILNEKKQEILIPVADDIIDKIDRKKKTIKVITPEGLLDIYN